MVQRSARWTLLELLATAIIAKQRAVFTAQAVRVNVSADWNILACSSEGVLKHKQSPRAAHAASQDEDEDTAEALGAGQGGERGEGECQARADAAAARRLLECRHGLLREAPVHLQAAQVPRLPHQNRLAADVAIREYRRPEYSHKDDWQWHLS